MVTERVNWRPYTVIRDADVFTTTQRWRSLAANSYKSSSSSLNAGDYLTSFEHEDYKETFGEFSNSDDGWQTILNEAALHLTELPPMEIQVPIFLTQEFEYMIVEWMSSFGPGPARVFFTRAPEILTGLVILYDGRSYDFSSRKTAKQFYENLQRIS